MDCSASQASGEAVDAETSHGSQPVQSMSLHIGSMALAAAQPCPSCMQVLLAQYRCLIVAVA
jgi:hypothetical protein